MSNLIYIMGKSASGKDTIYKKIKENMDVKSYILYTTRPIRTGEKEGEDYHYVSNEQMMKFEQEGRVIESRTYQTVKGPWTYATILDEQLEQNGDIITVGTLESYQKVKEYYEDKKDTKLVPVYITIEEEERKRRAIEREKKQEKPNYEEVERRLRADNIDFSKEKLEKVGIGEKQTFENDDLDTCVESIIRYIQRERNLDVREKYKVDIMPQAKRETIVKKEEVEERGISR